MKKRFPKTQSGNAQTIDSYALANLWFVSAFFVGSYASAGIFFKWTKRGKPFSMVRSVCP